MLLGGLLKSCLNEGIGRWQLLSDSTLLEGWIRHLPRFLSAYFFLYLLFWSVMVGAAMMSATGLAAHALWPALSVSTWGIVHALAAFVLVLAGAWRLIEGVMKAFMLLMFVAVLLCAALVLPESPGLLSELLKPSVPPGSLISVLSVMGGVGGSVTLLSYGYWMREAGWSGPERLATMRWDLSVAYGLTALFASAVLVLAAGVRPEVMTGSNMAVALADQLLPFTGEWGKWLFLWGFWGAVASSMLGVWHGVPYLFANFLLHWRHQEGALEQRESLTRGAAYRGYLVFLCFAPMALLFLDRPVWIVVLYAVTGAFFMPLLAALLLFLNSQGRHLGAGGNGPAMQIALWLCLLLFGALLFLSPSA